MKNLKLKCMALILMAAPFAHADSVSWKVGSVQGEIEAVGELKLEQAQAVISCHYCRLSTCAGGPTVETALATRLTQSSSSRYQLQIAAGEHNSRFAFKALHSCSYRVQFSGTQSQTGKPVTGSILLATSLKDSANPIFLDEMLAEGLTEKMQEPLRLEILKFGLMDPEIANENQTPYFNGR